MTDSPPLARVRLRADTPRALTAWSDAWVTTSTDGAAAGGVDCYLLSLLGAPAAVRGLQSAFLAHWELSVEPPAGGGIIVRHHWNATYRTRWSRLPSGSLHALLVADPGGAEPGGHRLVLARSEPELPDALFADLLASRGLLALPEWRHWLFRRLLEGEGAARLEGPLAALYVTASEVDLDALVQTGLRDGAIRFPAP